MPQYHKTFVWCHSPEDWDEANDWSDYLYNFVKGIYL